MLFAAFESCAGSALHTTKVCLSSLHIGTNGEADLDRVRSVHVSFTTAFGAERGMTEAVGGGNKDFISLGGAHRHADDGEVLASFEEHQEQAMPGHHLWKNALQIPGVLHNIDNLGHALLSSMVLWPDMSRRMHAVHRLLFQEPHR